METLLVTHIGLGRLISHQYIYALNDLLTTCGLTFDCVYKLQKDLDVMEELGVKGYRFSFAWSRILPSMYTLLIHICI